MGSGADGPYPGKEREAQVPNGEGASPIPRRPVLHDSLTPEDEKHVGHAGPHGDHGAVLHPCQGGDGVVELLEGEVGSGQGGVQAGELGVPHAQAVRADALFGDGPHQQAAHCNQVAVRVLPRAC